jgi:hypothetical protein
MAFQLPSPGDVQGQVAAGEQLVNQLQTGDVEGLLEAGISVAAGGGLGGAVLMDAVGGALSGFALGGPVGAAIGLGIGIAEGLADLFTAANSVTGIYGVSKATHIISSRITTMMGQNVSAVTNNPQGWALADWCSAARRPTTSKDPNGFLSTLRNIAQYMSSIGYDTDGAQRDSILLGLCSFPTGTNHVAADPYGPAAPPGVLGGSPDEQTVDASGEACSGQVSAKAALAYQVPLCTPVWFSWNQPSQITCVNSPSETPGACGDCLNFPSASGSAVNGTTGDASALYQTWIQSTFINPPYGLTQAEIVQRAAARLPDPFYFSSGLYGSIFGSGGALGFTTGFATVYFNPDLLNAMTTVMWMLSVGASTQAIVSELLLHAYYLSKYGDVDPTGASLAGYLSGNQYGFHRLLDDYLRRAAQENAAGVVATAGALTTSEKAGAVLAGASGVTLAALIVYSLTTRTPPLQVIRNVRTRIGRVFPR